MTEKEICIVVEKSDESGYWLEVITDANLSNKTKESNRLLDESTELTKIMSKAKSSTYSS